MNYFLQVHIHLQLSQNKKSLKSYKKTTKKSTILHLISAFYLLLQIISYFTHYLKKMEDTNYFLQIEDIGYFSK